jgi:hypothetical protein
VVISYLRNTAGETKELHNTGSEQLPFNPKDLQDGDYESTKGQEEQVTETEKISGSLIREWFSKASPEEVARYHIAMSRFMNEDSSGLIYNKYRGRWEMDDKVTSRRLWSMAFPVDELKVVAEDLRRELEDAYKGSDLGSMKEIISVSTVKDPKEWKEADITKVAFLYQFRHQKGTMYLQVTRTLEIEQLNHSWKKDALYSYRRF